MNYIKTKFYTLFLILVLAASVIFLSAFEDVMIGKLSICTAIFTFLILIKKHQKVETNE